MSGFIEYIKARLRGSSNKLTTERRAAPRFTTHLERRLVVNVSLADARNKAEGGRGPFVLAGYTRDLSETGLGIVLPDIRISNSNVTRPDRELRIVIGLPGGSVEMHAVAARHVKLEEDAESQGYFIGVRITKMSERDRSHYEAFLKTFQRTDFT
ncbi:MAG: PilZ domain-containing protein [Acidobacteria bacterium]|nr:PilZ domain-containing protein [Acidobacteriota bacterium]